MTLLIPNQQCQLQTRQHRIQRITFLAENNAMRVQSQLSRQTDRHTHRKMPNTFMAWQR